ncbi:gamma-glutamyl-gamma-aminobutyrate hydrolase family protein [Paraburkholderia sp. MMS20-SJTR3]|uniref:Gamma-glutamyl-gamma-aminobutyrate hydrolase family protein n=1 Tax=Paraburkholderia sejongensis TaxID=2886946 RepID=A0ABS8JZP0_9BURK|nr:type 1 glutamine amidotransferase [Paraburkholderia sp. MMS20-SJTR3]MCC8395094.1 gamma-glutamyl-gamma-aminobutyrate hydrolase family protein [Paraburkholderia sp. MMS20-SJTR3]
MSENKPENAGTTGSPSAATPTPTGAPNTATALPPSHEDATRSPAKDAATEEATVRSSTDDPLSASSVTPEDPRSARLRDAAEARSAAAESTARQEAAVHERDARRAGSHAGIPGTQAGTQAGARAGAHVGTQAGTTSAGTGATGAKFEPAVKPAQVVKPVPLVSEPPADVSISPASAPFGAVDVDVATEAPATTARAAGSPPPGFGAAPDFSAANPPPPNALPPTPPRYLRQSDSAWSVFGRIIAARARQLFDRAGQRITQRTLRIGVSARIFHPEPGAMGLRGKTLQYLEESIAHWVMSRDVLVFMIPTVGHQGMLHPSNIRLRDYAKHLDGLLLQGGADVSPQTYAEAASSHEWPGDRVRDMYELELLHEFIESGKPVLGVCRGCQLINVAFGGTLYQDIATDVPTAGAHVNENYDQHRHGVHFPDGSTLLNMFPGRRDAIVNSIHHQAVKTLGRDLNIEAVSASDGIIEAVRYRRAPFVMGVQWHPEFHRAGGPELLDCTPLLDTFLRVARETRF